MSKTKSLEQLLSDHSNRSSQNFVFVNLFLYPTGACAKNHNISRFGSVLVLSSCGCLVHHSLMTVVIPPYTLMPDKSTIIRLFKYENKCKTVFQTDMTKTSSLGRPFVAPGELRARCYPFFIVISFTHIFWAVLFLDCVAFPELTHRQ